MRAQCINSIIERLKFAGVTNEFESAADVCTRELAQLLRESFTPRCLRGIRF